MTFPVFASKQQARIDSVPPSIPITIGRVVVVVGDDVEVAAVLPRASVATDTTRSSSRERR